MAFSPLSSKSSVPLGILAIGAKNKVFMILYFWLLLSGFGCGSKKNGNPVGISWYNRHRHCRLLLSVCGISERWQSFFLLPAEKPHTVPFVTSYSFPTRRLVISLSPSSPSLGILRAARE
jgi:hypothetical protein